MPLKSILIVPTSKDLNKSSFTPGGEEEIRAVFVFALSNL